MHFKRIENIFKLKKIAWAENDCLSWMLLCNPLGAWELSQGDRSRNNSFIWESAGGGGEEQVIFLMISVNVLLPHTTIGLHEMGAVGLVAPSPWKTPNLYPPFLLAESAEKPPDQPRFILPQLARLDWEHGRLFLHQAGTLPQLQLAQPFHCSSPGRAGHEQYCNANK